MYVMYTGYLVAFYLALAAGAALHLPHHPHPLAGTLAYLVLIPVLLLGASVEVVALAPRPDKDAIRRALREGTLSRLRAFVTGFGVGVAALAAIGVIGLTGYWLAENWTAVAVAGTLILAVGALSPAVGAGLLVSYVGRQRLTNRCS
jgi:hypothetical protein